MTPDPTPDSPPLSRAPLVLALALRPLPLAPLSLSLSALTRRLVARHPGMVRRMGEYAARSILLDPVDLPFVLLMRPDQGSVRAHRRHRVPGADVQIAGPLSAFLGMVHGQHDGDALFFSRDLTVSGDTSAALALRNAIDDAELDLGAELTALTGPAAGLGERVVARMQAMTGLALHRADEGCSK